jgi:dynein heavy chain 1
MHIPFDDFDKVMSKCFEVFTCWDDEYDKLQGLLRYVSLYTGFLATGRN